jgi:hypothetical protein
MTDKDNVIIPFPKERASSSLKNKLNRAGLPPAEGDLIDLVSYAREFDNADIPAETIFMAVCKDRASEPEYTMYFVNNTATTIDTLLAIYPRTISKMSAELTIDDITDEFIRKHKGIQKYTTIKPGTYITVGKYYMWEFDFTNGCFIYLKSNTTEKHLRFDFDGYFIITSEPVKIPILKKSGWIRFASD